jgi:hypothetical protein
MLNSIVLDICTQNIRDEKQAEFFASFAPLTIYPASDELEV